MKPCMSTLAIYNFVTSEPVSKIFWTEGLFLCMNIIMITPLRRLIGERLVNLVSHSMDIS